MKDHHRLLSSDNLPLETPSHNGPYQGTLQVRVIAPGVGSEEKEQYGPIKAAQERRAERVRKMNAARVHLCSMCKKERPIAGKFGRFCSSTCRTQYTSAHRRNRARKVKRTKW